jgi:hypothetical protein
MQQICANDWCKQSFEVTEEDLAFYDKISPVFAGKKYPIPAPTQCPDCRRQRRMGWRNERMFYHRKCDLCKKATISVHAPDHPYPVYCNPCWYSDSWDALAYGQAFVSEESFFTQCRRLHDRVPQRAMVNDDGVMSENCAYTFDVAYAKNCYMCFGMWKAQDCLHCRICDQSKLCVDCEGVKIGSELVYESVDSQRLYRCAYIQNSENCRDCWFGFDLKGCSECIACMGLRQKQYCIFNEQKTREEYEQVLSSLSSFSEREKMQSTFAAFIRDFPRRNMNLQNCEDCVGDHLFGCRNVWGFVCTNSEHSRWIERSDGPKWTYDNIQSGAPEWCLECITVDNGNMNAFCTYCNQCHDVLYSDNCLSGDMLLGCVSLRHKKHCILNVQYTSEEYGALAGRVIAQMQRAGEFGEFLPLTLSIYGYNETNAIEAYPLSAKDVQDRGWHWRNELPRTTGRETITPERIPDRLQDVPPTIVDAILACTTCGRNYKRG